MNKAMTDRDLRDSICQAYGYSLEVQHKEGLFAHIRAMEAELRERRNTAVQGECPAAFRAQAASIE
jgi:hypothetical protein